MASKIIKRKTKKRRNPGNPTIQENQVATLIAISFEISKLLQNRDIIKGLHSSKPEYLKDLINNMESMENWIYRRAGYVKI